jgi:hypothetical protein
LGYVGFNVSNDTIELPGSWSNAHGAARPAIYRSLGNCARHGSGSKHKPMRNIEIAVASRRAPVEQSGDRGRCFDIGDIGWPVGRIAGRDAGAARLAWLPVNRRDTEELSARAGCD